MTSSARTVETNTADALAELLAYVGDSDNAAYWLGHFERSFSSPIRSAEPRYYHGQGAVVIVSFEDGSVLHLTVTQIKEPNQ